MTLTGLLSKTIKSRRPLRLPTFWRGHTHNRTEDARRADVIFLDVDSEVHEMNPGKMEVNDKRSGTDMFAASGAIRGRDVQLPP
jgi:hypothetical protein